MSAETMPETTDDDAHLNDLLGPAPEPEDDTPESAPEPEPEAEAKDEPPAKADEPGDEPDIEEPEEEPEKPAAEAEPEKAEATSDAETEKKRADGLLAEVRKLREQLRTEQLKRSQQQAPPPTGAQPAPAQETPQKKQGGVPVVVSEDGSQVYVDPDALGPVVEERARAIVEQSQRPTEAQLAEMRERQVLSEFIAENPETHQTAVQRALQAEEFIGLKGQQIALQHGYQLRGPDDLVAILRQTGADAEIATHFPEIAPMLPEFIEAAASGQPQWKQSIYRRIAAAQGTATEPDPESPAPKLKDVSQSPQALARKGGGRTVSPTTEEREFDALETEYRRDIFNFPEKKYQRMVELGRKLQKPGVV